MLAGYAKRSTNGVLPPYSVEGLIYKKPQYTSEREDCIQFKCLVSSKTSIDDYQQFQTLYVLKPIKKMLQN
ncbi:hypothetical protein GCM10023149_29430 [Mucilaginibacter gynuensis]|uniref:Uncharacterized protein n=1 Tax=Mucilaginibacter gynuensis TaxID=1302236 RepID=A0ABP8GMA5_9SPHI